MYYTKDVLRNCALREASLNRIMSFVTGVYVLKTCDKEIDMLLIIADNLKCHVIMRNEVYSTNNGGQ